MTSIAGFQLRPQSYIAGTQLIGTKDTWYWPGNASKPQTFNYFLSVSFREALDNKAVESAEDVMKTIANDLFYPFNIHAFK